MLCGRSSGVPCFAAHGGGSIDELPGRTTGRLGYIRPTTAHAIGGTAELALRYSYHLRIHLALRDSIATPIELALRDSIATPRRADCTATRPSGSGPTRCAGLGVKLYMPRSDEARAGYLFILDAKMFLDDKQRWLDSTKQAIVSTILSPDNFDSVRFDSNQS